MGVRVRISKNDFRPLSDGNYEGVLTDTTITTEVAEGKFPYLTTYFRTVDAELGERKVKDFYSFSPKAVWRLTNLLTELEVPFEIVEVATEEVDADGNAITVEELDFNPEDLDGKSCIASITSEKSTSSKNGKEYTNNKITSIKKPL